MKGFSTALKNHKNCRSTEKNLRFKKPGFLNSQFKKNHMFGLLYTLNLCTDNNENMGILDGSALENCFPFK